MQDFKNWVVNWTTSFNFESYFLAELLPPSIRGGFFVSKIKSVAHSGDAKAWKFEVPFPVFARGLMSSTGEPILSGERDAFLVPAECFDIWCRHRRGI
jgi:hypothetical protein